MSLRCRTKLRMADMHHCFKKWSRNCSRHMTRVRKSYGLMKLCLQRAQTPLTSGVSASRTFRFLASRLVQNTPPSLLQSARDVVLSAFLHTTMLLMRVASLNFLKDSMNKTRAKDSLLWWTTYRLTRQQRWKTRWGSWESLGFSMFLTALSTTLSNFHLDKWRRSSKSSNFNVSSMDTNLISNGRSLKVSNAKRSHILTSVSNTAWGSLISSVEI